MELKIPEKNKKDGVCYAVTDDGLELPVIDITHPAFAFSISAAELDTLIENMQRSSSLPSAVLQSVAQKSILFRGLAESAGTYTTGMMTYLNKLEPDNLGDGYATPVDRQWAASLTPVTFRWRMRHVARLLADGLAPALSQRTAAPLNLINIAGGPAMDSLNALILLQKERPGLLAGRQISLHVLDLDSQGPSFGGRALAALQAQGAPLDGLSIRLTAIRYDWSEVSTLQELTGQLEAEAVVAGSSEGGLFEYATDDEIVTNLMALHTGTPADIRMVGPVVRDSSTLDPRLRGTEHVPGRPAIRYIGLDAFGKLAQLAGWTIEQTLDGPMHQVVSLMKA
jgi:hypothetical protein